ncbi:protein DETOXIFICATION 17-like [Euphorbia lathyris]|uniref:protein DETOXIFICATION 17-like n=1 Tax=Euphorbia lathyris TaxID=212925 RepID=UPI00331379C3
MTLKNMDIEKNDHTPNITAEASTENVGEKGEGFSKKEILGEMKKQILIAVPLVLLNLSCGLMQMVGISFVGHLGVLPLSAASIANSFASMAGYTLSRGLGSTLETFCGQAYGAKQYRLLGIHMQRGMLIVLIISIPIAVMFSNAGEILKFLRQNHEIADEAGRYSRLLVPGFFAMALVECVVRFLQTQNKVNSLMIASGIATLVCIPISWALVFKTSLGIMGASMAISIYGWLLAFMLIAYILLSPSFKETWTGFSSETFHGIPKFLKLAIPATLMLSLEVWSLEIVVLLSGLLPNPKLEASVLSISFNMHMLTYMLPFGLSGAVSTRVSNELGAGRPQAARLAVYAAVFMVAMEGLGVATIIVSGRRYWGHLFSHDKELVKYVAHMMPILATSHFINAIQTVLSGTCRGCGWQKIGAFVNMGSYYIVGIPLAAVLAFVFHVGGKGLWIGITVAMFVQAICLSTITLCTDWDKQARIAMERVRSGLVAKEANVSS